MKSNPDSGSCRSSHGIVSRNREQHIAQMHLIRTRRGLGTSWSRRGTGCCSGRYKSGKRGHRGKIHCRAEQWGSTRWQRKCCKKWWQGSSRPQAARDQRLPHFDSRCCTKAEIMLHSWSGHGSWESRPLIRKKKREKRNSKQE